MVLVFFVHVDQILNSIAEEAATVRCAAKILQFNSQRFKPLGIINKIDVDERTKQIQAYYCAL